MTEDRSGTIEMITAIYARFSSDKQTEKSIEDQVARCREIAIREGSGLCQVYTDEALSGTSMANRPGLQKLLEDIEAGRLSMVITESLDRLSRDQADLALIDRCRKQKRVRLITASDGEIQDGASGIMQVGMRAIFGAMYVADLRDKTLRGQKGVARDGRIPGGQCYGYRAIEGETRGLREIVPEECDVVVRIFQEYAAGRSPRAIAKSLNAEGIPGPRGKPWGVTTILGNHKRRTGILSNPLYNGELIFNRQRRLKNPATAATKMVPNPPSEWIHTDIEELRIVPPELYAKVLSMREASSGTRPEFQRRPKRLLAGLVKCGVCDGSYRTVSPGRYGCANHRDRGSCDNTRTIAIPALEGRVLDGLRRRMLTPAAVAYAVDCYRERTQELEGNNQTARDRLEGKIQECEGTIQLAKNHLKRGVAPPDWLFDSATEAEQQVKALKEQLESLEEPRVVKLHPNAATSYRSLIANLNAGLSADDSTSTTEAINALRKLVSRIVITPGNARGEVFVEVEGDLAALLELQESGRTAVTLGAGVGFEPTTFRL